MNSFKKHTFILVFFLAVVSIAGISGAFSKSDSISSYKNKTAIECVEDKDCFWFAFQRYTNIENTKKLIRWEEPIRFILIGANKLKVVDVYTKNIEVIKPYFPHGFTYDNNLNFLFVVTDDPQNVKKFYQKTITDNFGSILYKTIENNISENTAFEQAYLEVPEGRRFGGVQVIKAKKDDSDTKTPYYLLDSLGFYASGLDHKKFLSDELKNGNELNKMHLFLIKALYDPRLKPGMTLSDIQQIFPSIYEDIIK